MLDRVKKLSILLLERYRGSFTEDFEGNKVVLERVAKIRSKSLRNRMAGYITNIMRKEKAEEGKKEEIISTATVSTS